MANNNEQSEKITETANTTATVAKKGLTGGIKNAAAGAVNTVGNIFGKIATAFGVPKQAVALVLAASTIITSVSIYDANVNGSTNMAASNVKAEAGCAEPGDTVNTQMLGSNGLLSDEQVVRGKTIYKYLHSLGYTDEAVAGILSNATADSGLQSERYEGDDITDAFGLLRNHHTNWDAYTEALFDIYSGTVESSSYSAGAVNMFMGSGISGSAYQTAGAFYNAHASQAKQAYVVTGSGDEESYLPGFGLWMLAGKRAEKMLYLANSQAYPIDNDNDGNNDAIFETPLQIAYLYYENYADVNTWAQKDFYGAKTLLINRNKTYDTDESLTDPNKWEVVRCIKAPTEDTTVYQYYRIFIKETEKRLPNGHQTCPYGVYTSGGKTLDAPYEDDVPEHDVVNIQYTIKLTPVTYTFTIKNNSADSAEKIQNLENMLKGIAAGATQDDVERKFDNFTNVSSNNCKYEKYDSNTYYSEGTYEDAGASEYKDYTFTTTAYWNWICNQYTPDTEDIYIPDNSELIKKYNDYDKALKDYKISKELVEKIKNLITPQKTYENKKIKYNEAVEDYNKAVEDYNKTVHDFNEAKEYRDNLNEKLGDAWEQFNVEYQNKYNAYKDACNEYTAASQESSNPDRTRLVSAAKDLFLSIYGTSDHDDGYYKYVYNKIYIEGYNNEQALRSLLGKSFGNDWENDDWTSGFVDDMVRMVAVIGKMSNNTSYAENWANHFANYVGLSPDTIDVKGYMDTWLSTDVTSNDMNDLISVFNTCLKNVIKACFGELREGTYLPWPTHTYRPELIANANANVTNKQQAMNDAKQVMNDAKQVMNDAKQVMNDALNAYMPKYTALKNYYRNNRLKLTERISGLWNKCFKVYFRNNQSDSVDINYIFYSSLDETDPNNCHGAYVSSNIWNQLKDYAENTILNNVCKTDVSDKRTAFWREAYAYQNNSFSTYNNHYNKLEDWENDRSQHKITGNRKSINYYSVLNPYDQKYMINQTPRGFDTWWYQYNGEVPPGSGTNFRNIYRRNFADINDPLDDANNDGRQDHNESDVHYYVDGPERFVKYHHRYEIRWKNTDYSNYDSDSDRTDGYRGFLTKASKQTTSMWDEVYSDPDDLTTLEGVEFPYIQYQDGEDIAYEDAVWFYKHWKDRSYVSEDEPDFENHVATARYWYYLIRMNDWSVEEDDRVYDEYYKQRILSMIPEDGEVLTQRYLGSMHDEEDKMCGVTSLNNSTIASLAANLSYPYGSENYTVNDTMSKTGGYYQAVHCTELYAAVYNACACIQQYENSATIAGPNNPIYSSPGAALWTVVRASGRDDDFPSTLEAQAEYLDTNSDKDGDVDEQHKWKFVGTIKKDVPEGSTEGVISLEDILKKLKPGDICINDDTAFIFVGLNTALNQFNSYYGRVVDTSYAICTAVANKEDEQITGTGLTCIIAGTKAEVTSATNNPIQTLVEGSDSEFKVYRSIYDNYQMSTYYQVMRVADMDEYHNGMLSETVKYAGGSINDIMKIGFLSSSDIEEYKKSFLAKSPVQEESEQESEISES